MNYKIVLDAGHGGSDPGAVGGGIIEKDLTLKITEYLYDKFKKRGIPVYATRLTDETITPTDRVNRVLSAFGNDSNVIVLSNHINAGGGDGAEVIYPLRSDNTLPNMILDEMRKKGQNIRRAYQRRLPSNPDKDYYFMQRNTGDTESLTVEYGFLDSTKDDINQLKNDYKKLADAVYDAVLKYIGLDSDIDYYVVKQGDTLYSIAKDNNITLDTLKSLNSLTSDILSIGQILTLKPDVLEKDFYIVEKGDTLYSIAKKNMTDVNTLKSLNNLSNNIVSIGQKLILPSKYQEPEISVPSNNYIVEKGDTLYSIALKNGLTVGELLEANNLSNNTISIGQMLIIPNKRVYTVEKGDTLYSIAKKYNTTVDKIKLDNNLNSNTLSIGQLLVI